MPKKYVVLLKFQKKICTEIDGVKFGISKTIHHILIKKLWFLKINSMFIQFQLMFDQKLWQIEHCNNIIREEG